MGWIHVNCGVTCHNSNPGAEGYGAAMLLRLDPTQLNGSPPDSTWDIINTTINVPCISGSLQGEPRILPGNADSSVIYQLINERGGAVQMPPIASLLVDTPDVAVVRAWIQAMSNSDGGVMPGDAGQSDAGFGDGGHHGGHDGGSLDGGEHDAGEHDAAPDATLPDAASGSDDAGEDAQSPGEDAGADAEDSGQ